MTEQGNPRGQFERQTDAVSPHSSRPGVPIMTAKRRDGVGEPTATAAATGELKFAASDGFQGALRRRVAQYFRRTGRRPRDCPRMYLKTAIIFAWFAASYGLLVFLAGTWWLAVPLVISLGLAMAAVGFNIQHDAGHGAYSDRGWVNKLMALTLDLLGGSSYVWGRKHNSVHHTYANITGHDGDIDLGFIGRLSPHQKRLPFHRLQHFYLWALYGLVPIKWQFYDDFQKVITGRIGAHRLARPKGWNLVSFIGGKVCFFALALGLPLLLHPLWAVALAYVGASLVQGVVLSVVFQMAHCVEEAAFPLPRPDTGRMDAAWAEHQVETTVDFARRSRLLSWFIGGLNFQIEHHLFPRICHIHYPMLAPLVEETCREFGLRYVAHKSFLEGVVAHFRWLRRMGMPATV
ncbi:MAG TPA: acyl-CoA desaturase [Gemmataceae bacterium]|nr:acyl-CoA desaturase [Gemmataceae bacterium]